SNGQWHGVKAGAGTHTKKYWEELRLGRISEDQWIDLEGRMTRSAGTCNTMGTASTMTSIADAMGMTITGASSIPAVDSGHARMVSLAGSRIVEMVWEDLKPTDILTRSAIMNGIAAYMALGGSTNAAIHLIAIAGRAGVELTLDDMAQVSARIPVLANLFPSGNNLMEDFYFAGGMKALLARIGEHLDLTAVTVEGRTLGEAIAGAECWNDDVIRTPANPVIPIAKGRTLALLRGNLAPDGAVMKTSAASPHLLRHEGPALVFDGPEDMRRRVDDPDLDVTADTILVLRGAGPVGAPGMPEWGNLQIPKKLQQKGVTDMVRISDGRMSGTHYGTCVLHVAPESAVGGPLALLKTGDRIRLDADAGTLDMLVDAEELDRRRREWSPPERYSRSFAALYQAHVSQADKGCDFDFLAGTAPVPEPEIF
ncbi:MAG: dihydroxy-acid dehydratase, partial [Rhizobiaceae bacterium]